MTKLEIQNWELRLLWVNELMWDSPQPNKSDSKIKSDINFQLCDYNLLETWMDNFVCVEIQVHSIIVIHINRRLTRRRPTFWMERTKTRICDFLYCTVMVVPMKLLFSYICHVSICLMLCAPKRVLRKRFGFKVSWLLRLYAHIVDTYVYFHKIYRSYIMVI